MKISEDDIKNIFSRDEIISNEKSGEFQFEPNLKVKKILPNGDEIALRKVRKNISGAKKQVSNKKNKKPSSKIDTFLKFLAVLGAATFVFYALMNYDAFYKQASWLYYTEYLNERVPQPKDEATAVESKSTYEGEKISLPGSLPSFNNELTVQNRLVIDKINVETPISWDTEESDILTKLKDGVAQYKDTSKPGEGGNVFIVGHSSNYSWIKSDYNSIFALLDKLIRGDKVVIYKNNKKYTYEVVDQKVVSPKNVEAIEQTPEEYLTLMTCWPVGSTLNRLIVSAKLQSIGI